MIGKIDQATFNSLGLKTDS